MGDEEQQGPTTGRWHLVSGRRPRGWSEVPLWYRVLDRFGLPTLFAIGLGFAMWHLGERFLNMWDADQKAMIAALEALTNKIERVIFVPAVPPKDFKPQPEPSRQGKR